MNGHKVNVEESAHNIFTRVLPGASPAKVS